MGTTFSKREIFCLICFLIAGITAFTLVIATIVLSARVYPAPLENLPIWWRICCGVVVLAYIASIMAMVIDPNRVIDQEPRPSWQAAAKSALWPWVGLCASQAFNFLVSRKTDQMWLIIAMMPLAYVILLVGIKWIRPMVHRTPVTKDEPDGAHSQR